MIATLSIEVQIEVENISDVDDDSIGNGLWNWIAEGEGLVPRQITTTVTS